VTARLEPTQNEQGGEPQPPRHRIGSPLRVLRGRAAARGGGSAGRRERQRQWGWYRRDVRHLGRRVAPDPGGKRRAVRPRGRRVQLRPGRVIPRGGAGLIIEDQPVRSLHVSPTELQVGRR
jgi:hypothetical protein